MEEDPGAPLILGRLFLATSRALIDMESGELMLRVHDECLIINIYKSLHSSSGAQTCMKINSIAPANTKPPEITNPRQECKVTTLRSGKSTRNDIQNQESAEDSCSPPPKEKKKKEPVSYMPKPLYPQRLEAENNNKALKKEPKEENATNNSMKFQLIQKVPYLPTIMGSSNRTCIVSR
ncbi:hypothetical protein PIB30_098148 [Stylosanthes scabra]|uniref:Uncharacterized protein n=1 Tax=Stylosanthes scabra TaxID=79078 RepID=A0ABU6QXD5_9FABA|nr:hypothetical protein [Stylosanthes scabra]